MGPLIVLAVSQFLVAVDFDIVFVALPQIGRGLGFGPADLQWVVSAYTVALGGFLLLGGRLADRVGARRMFLAGMVVFGAASLAGALATVPLALVVARAVQGVGAAAVIPASLALIGATFAEGPERNRAFAVWGGAGSAGAAVGALGGGMLTAAFGWQAVLLVNVPVAVALVVGTVLALIPDGPRRAGSFDVTGALLVTAGATVLVLGIVERSWVVTAGVALLALFAVWERRPAQPLVVWRCALLPPVVAVFLFMGGVGSAYYLITTFLQDALGWSPLAAGLGFLPMSVLSMVGSTIVFPRLVARRGVDGALLVGMTGIGVALAGMALSVAAGSYWVVAPWLVWALFAGVAFPAVFRTAGARALPGEEGVAAALVSTSQYVGGAVGLAAIVALSGLDRAVGRAELLDALRAMGLLAAAVVLAGAVSLAIMSRARRDRVVC
jgi:MFS family permease